MTLHIRNLLALLIVACCSSKALADHVAYAFESAETGLYGEITFDTTNENFAPGGTATVWNGAIVNYWFQRGDIYGDLSLDFLFEYDAEMSIQFNANGTSPDDIVSCGGRPSLGWNGDFEWIVFVPDASTNGSFELEVWGYDPVTIVWEQRAHGTDGTLSLAPMARDMVELYGVVIEENGDVTVEYCKNYLGYADLYRESPLEITHDLEWSYFWQPGCHVVTNSGSSFLSLAPGERVFLKVRGSDTRSASVTVNSRPVAYASRDQEVPCTGDTVVQLDGTGSYDPDGDAMTIYWQAPVVLDDPTSPMPLGVFPMGMTIVTLIVTDELGAVDTDYVVITVSDDAPPEVTCTTDVTSLTPADHTMVAVGVSVAATDACDAPDELRLDLVTLESSEPDDARGGSDGSTTGDTHGSDGYVSPVDVTHEFVYNPETELFEGMVLLRAECNTKGSGRTYTINAAVSDTAGNFAGASCVVVVPVDNTGGGGGNGRGRKK